MDDLTSKSGEAACADSLVPGDGEAVEGEDLALVVFEAVEVEDKEEAHTSADLTARQWDRDEHP